MSRHGYSDFDDYDMESFLRGMGWRNAVRCAIKGKRGQAFLRELGEALDALPTHELSAVSFTRGGEICALGAVALKRGIDVSRFEPELDENGEVDYDDDIDPIDEPVAATFGIARSMAAEIMYQNDDGAYNAESPTERWTRMRKWVDRHITKPPEPTT